MSAHFTAETENGPLYDRQHGIHGTRQANPRFAGFIICIIELNTRCATSDVNPFKIRCNLQITKATVYRTALLMRMVTNVINEDGQL